MKKQIPRDLVITMLLALAMIPGAKLVGSQTSNNGKAQNGQTQNNQAAASQNAKPFDQAQALADLRKAIAGQENKPAAEVFKNIQMLKAMPAGRLLRVMELGYAKSLGVNCTHCHVAGEWEKEDKPTKQITREYGCDGDGHQHRAAEEDQESEEPRSGNQLHDVSSRSNQTGAQSPELMRRQ